MRTSLTVGLALSNRRGQLGQLGEGFIQQTLKVHSQIDPKNYNVQKIVGEIHTFLISQTKLLLYNALFILYQSLPRSRDLRTKT